MAGLYVSGVKKPYGCTFCPWCQTLYCFCKAANKDISVLEMNKGPDWCPLVEVPDHGDLIDRGALSRSLDELCNRVCQYSKAQRKVMCSSCPLGDAFIVVEDDAPAIIEEDPKERSEDKR